MTVHSLIRLLSHSLSPLWGKVARTECASEGGPPFRLAALGTVPHKGGRKITAVVFALVVPFALSGCGFHPLYATDDVHGGARQVFASIYVETIPDERIGYELRNALIDNLQAVDKPADASWRLAVTVDQYVQGVAVATNSEVTRYNYTLNARYQLSDAHTGKVMKSGIESTLSAYDVVASPYATLAAQRDAQKRGASDVAYRIQIALSAWFSRHAPVR
jgi:LPS-assembly lipoprotein